MTTKIVQSHPLKGTREFELVDDTIEYRIQTAFGVEELTVVLSALDPEPVIDGSMLHFVSEINREPLVKMFIDKPDAKIFNAFVSVLRERITAEDFGRFAVDNRDSDITIEEVDTTINMLETYLNPSEIAELLVALRELRANPSDSERLSSVIESFNGLGPQQGPVLTYAPFFMSLLASNELDDG